MAATARAALLKLAAEKLATDVADLTIKAGVISSKSLRKTVSFDALLGGRYFAVKFDGLGNVVSRPFVARKKLNAGGFAMAR